MNFLFKEHAMKFLIKAIDFASSATATLEAPRDFVIDIDDVILVAPIGQSMRARRMAPITANIAVIYKGDLGDNHMVYLQSRLLEEKKFLWDKFANSQTTPFLRACEAEGKITGEELTPEILRQNNLVVFRDASTLNTQILGKKKPEPR